MPDVLDDLIQRHNLTAEKIAKICGVSERTAREWVERKRNFPEPARRLLLIVLGDARPEDYR
jgi:DNA-binding transcriptional regulator YiaG